MELRIEQLNPLNDRTIKRTPLSVVDSTTKRTLLLVGQRARAGPMLCCPLRAADAQAILAKVLVPLRLTLQSRTSNSPMALLGANVALVADGWGAEAAT